MSVLVEQPLQHPDQTLPHQQQIAALLQQYADGLASVITADPSSLQWRYLPHELALISGAAPIANHTDH